ncbi:alpha/beta fold hydrolase [Pseudarthrobacter sp. AG30]|uniref:alpha/beta fold hydrolase n=1 Tax=Pseudarthrobacter sp. AG30 TaxID=2249742 RepID=UPI000D6438D0|nr:alpha/beta hydrolase [Pseudarthrobacter sp. AG30]RAX17045.1 alpha/beta fold hydrolase [Pseudarthrobacter sp. AG30]
MSSETSPTLIDTTLGPLMVRRTGAGAPALLWHSLFVDSQTFDGVLEDLGRHRELFLVDGPGHGGSPGPRRRYSLEECATAAAQVLDASGVSSPVDWVGNAWGGHVGIVFARTFPARIRTLTTIGTPAYPFSRAERLQTSLLVYLYRVLGPGPFSGTIVEALAGHDVAKTSPAAAEAVRDAFRRGNKQGKYWAMQSVMLERPDLRPVLPLLRAPTLMLVGRDDPMNDPEQAQRAARSVPDGRFARVTGAGHVAPLLLAPHEVTQHVLAFWSETLNRQAAA